MVMLYDLSYERRRVLNNIERIVKEYPVDPENEVRMGYFVFNKKTHQMKCVGCGLFDVDTDCFPEIFMNESKGKNVLVEENACEDWVKQNGSSVYKMVYQTLIWASDPGSNSAWKIAAITHEKDNPGWGTLTFLQLPTTSQIGDNFLSYDTGLEELYIPCAKTMGKKCLFANECLYRLDAEKLEETGDDCFKCNTELSVFHCPNYERSGKGILEFNRKLSIFDSPKYKVQPRPDSGIYRYFERIKAKERYEASKRGL